MDVRGTLNRPASWLDVDRFVPARDVESFMKSSPRFVSLSGKWAAKEAKLSRGNKIHANHSGY
jgi:phosphopantetheinyl transferase (holo-ACP synthase)